MNYSTLLTKLKSLYNMEEVKKGFPSQQACIDWANQVAPLLKFNQQYYANFAENAHKMNLNLSSYTLVPAFRIMVSQLQMAINELESKTEESEDKPKHESKDNDKKNVFVACGQLTQREINLGKSVEGLINKNPGFKAFLAETCEDPNGLTPAIFENLNKCVAFIAILHERDYKIGRLNNYEYYSNYGSLWINQEIAITSFLRFQRGSAIPWRVYYEKGVKQAGLINYLAGKPTVFSDDSEILENVEIFVKEVITLESKKLSVQSKNAIPVKTNIFREFGNISLEAKPIQQNAIIKFTEDYERNIMFTAGAILGRKLDYNGKQYKFVKTIKDTNVYASFINAVDERKDIDFSDNIVVTDIFSNGQVYHSCPLTISMIQKNNKYIIKHDYIFQVLNSFLILCDSIYGDLSINKYNLRIKMEVNNNLILEDIPHYDEHDESIRTGEAVNDHFEMTVNAIRKPFIRTVLLKIREFYGRYENSFEKQYNDGIEIPIQYPL